MRILPSNPVLFRRHSLAFAGILAVGLGPMSGCARFPTNGVGEFSRISFRLRVTGNINDATDDSPLTQYIYIIALRVLTTDTTPPTGAPIPVLGDNSPNGFVAGSPTHFVLYDPTRPSQPLVLNKFNPGPTAGDPTNEINLASWFDTSATRGRIVNYTLPGDGDRRELRFDIFANQLADSDTAAANLRRIQVNFLTMNRLATTSGSRVWDALGNSLNPGEVNTFVTVDLRSNVTVDNRLGVEPQNDTVGANDPDVDISDFSIEVQRP